MKLATRVALCLALYLTPVAKADEGMWLFNAAPKERIHKKYGFQITQPWLDHLRLGSVRFNNGGSGSFVSADGLTFTNHHVASECIQQLGTKERDLLKTGFYAGSHAEEARCPDLELNQLLEITDVTQKIMGAAKPGMAAADIARAQRAAMAEIESGCAQPGKNIRCDVVTLYSGSMYHLYRYKKYTDVRLVFAPEQAIAFFGGDADNFEFPRYDLDITFVRVYEDEKPARLKHYLKWAKQGVRENDLVFVSGHPGSTGRLQTVAQLELLRDVTYPWRMETYKHIIDRLKAFSRKSEEHRRIAQDEMLSYENSYKATVGYNSGLTDARLMAAKKASEEQMKAAVMADPRLKAEFGQAWDEVAEAMKVLRNIFLELQYVERGSGFRSKLSEKAHELVRLAAERQKPSSERLREYRESALPSLEQSLLAPAPIYKEFETFLMAGALADMQQRLGRDHAAVKRVLMGKSPAEAAQHYIDGTALDKAEVRKQLYDGGAQAIEASRDPLIALWRDIDEHARAVRKRYDDEVDAVVRRSAAAVNKLRFEQAGLDLYPDATFTLRLSYGAVKGFVEDGRGNSPQGTKVPYFTTMAGTFDHAQRHGNAEPYQLPESWLRARKKIKGAIAFNFVCTADIIGGSSGSPVVNRAGEVVGIIFDGNIQSLPWNFQYDDSIGRAVSVDARAITEALRTIYGAAPVAEELLKGAR